MSPAEPISEKTRTGTTLSLEYGTAEAPGYHTLASLMGRDGEYAIFRKFSSLNMLNLLRMQAGLLELEEEYKRILFRNEKSPEGIPLATSFKQLHNAKDSRQNAILNEIGVKLDKYSKSRSKSDSALLKCAQVNSLAKPRAFDLKFIRDWLYGARDGEGKGFLAQGGTSVEVLTWSKDHNNDFAAITSDTERDIWSSKIVAGLLTVWHYTCGRHQKPKHNLGVIEYSGLESTTKFIVTILSAMVPAVSIIALYFEKNLLKRIWIMIGLTVAFATMLSIFTGAKRIEIFSATAAFAAVEVIFIGSTDVGNRLTSVPGV